MSADVTAHIVVGLTEDKLDITKMPCYDEFIADDSYTERNFSALFDFYYLVKDKLPFGYIDLKAIGTSYFFDIDPNQYAVGFEICKTNSWYPHEININKLNFDIEDKSSLFLRLFNKVPEVILVGRYW